MLDQDLATSLGAALRGEALTPDDEGYEAARALYNGMIDLRPANLPDRRRGRILARWTCCRTC